MKREIQLSMFEPEGEQALELLAGKLGEVQKALALVQRMTILRMPGAARMAQRLAAQAESDALVFAILLDLEREAGL